MKRWKRLLLALSSGTLLSLGWPEVGGFAPLLFIGFVPLLLLEDAALESWKAGAKWRLYPYSYLAFLVFNIWTTWWVWYASDFGAVAAIGFNALFMNGIFILFHITRKWLGDTRGFAGLLFYWIGWEYIHMNWDLTWPWLTLGNGWAESTRWVQWYEYTGVAGGTVWMWIVNIALFYLVRLLWKQRSWHPSAVRPLVTSLLLIAIPISWSMIRYAGYEDQGDSLDVVAVQPNVDPYNEKFNGLPSPAQVQKILDLASQKTDSLVDYVIAPETAIPQSFEERQFVYTQEYQLLRSFASQYRNLRILIGASSYVIYGEERPRSLTARQSEQGFWYDFSNTAVHLGPAVMDTAFYHKSKMVPGVEMMPFPWIFQHFQDIAFNLGGTTGSLAGQPTREAFPSADGKARVAPVICYESVYGEFVGNYINQAQANAIFIITNDGWWENTAGHRQHMHYARLRAIEHRRSIARSANTGISCFINQRGDVSQATAWWVPDVIRETIRLNNETTFYTRYGDYIARTSLVFGGFLIIFVLSVYIKSKGVRHS